MDKAFQRWKAFFSVLHEYPEAVIPAQAGIPFFYRVHYARMGFPPARERRFSR
jgi:hypothetical protein